MSDPRSRASPARAIIISRARRSQHRQRPELIMTLTLDLSPEVESQLRQIIAQRDSAAAKRLLADALAPAVETLFSRPVGPPSSTQFKATLDRLVTEAGEDLPPLSDQAVSREGIYGDHP